jgi:hypothetical protein
MLYRGEDKLLDRCKYCKQSRYEEETEEAILLRKVNNETKSSSYVNLEQKIQRYTPRYVYRYCPLIPRLKLLLAHPVLSHLFWWGYEHMKNEDNDVVDDVHQADGYHQFSKYFPMKSEDPINGICDLRIALGVGADRASMSKHKQRNDYAVLPILVTIFEWPIWFRNKEKHLLLAGIPPFQCHDPSLFFGMKTMHDI